MRPEGLGIIFHKGVQPLFFTSYSVVREKGKFAEEDYLLVELATGGTIEVHSYYSKRLERVVKAAEAIYKEPGEAPRQLRKRCNNNL